MSRSFILGVDLDGVCGDYHAFIKEFVAEDRGIPAAELTDNITWNYPEWGLTKEEYQQLHTRAVKEKRLFLNMPMIRDASEVLWELSDAGIWIRIITHRLFISGSHAVCAGDTVQWLDNFNIPYRDICFIGGKQDVGADVYIEDSPDQIASLRAAGHDVIVFNQPYNWDLAGPRAGSWQDIKELVLKVYSQFEIFHPQLPGLEATN